MKYNTTPVVDAIGKMNFSGNITPPAWYQTITTANGKKAHQNAITILSEIVYWHRPSEIRDEPTGALLGFKKKFKSDKWQRSYASLGDKFGLSKRQVKTAIDRLIQLGIVTREFRNFMSDSGIFLSNVMYLELVPEGLSLATYPPVVPKKGGGGTKKADTYTKTPTKIPTKIDTSEKACSLSTRLEADDGWNLDTLQARAKAPKPTAITKATPSPRVAAPLPQAARPTCAFDTAGSRYLQDSLVKDARAKGRRGISRFASIQMKERFIALEKAMGLADTQAGIDAAMERGVCSVAAVVAYVGGIHKGANKPKKLAYTGAQSSTYDPPATLAVAKALAAATFTDFEVNRRFCMNTAAKLVNSEIRAATPDLIREKYGKNSWWYKKDWRGQKGDAPTTTQLERTWGQWDSDAVRTKERQQKGLNAILANQL